MCEILYNQTCINDWVILALCITAVVVTMTVTVDVAPIPIKGCNRPLRQFLRSLTQKSAQQETLAYEITNTQFGFNISISTREALFGQNVFTQYESSEIVLPNVLRELNLGSIFF